MMVVLYDYNEFHKCLLPKKVVAKSVSYVCEAVGVSNPSVLQSCLNYRMQRIMGTMCTVGLTTQFCINTTCDVHTMIKPTDIFLRTCKKKSTILPLARTIIQNHLKCFEVEDIKLHLPCPFGDYGFSQDYNLSKKTALCTIITQHWLFSSSFSIT